MKKIILNISDMWEQVVVFLQQSKMAPRPDNLSYIDTDTLEVGLELSLFLTCSWEPLFIGRFFGRITPILEQNTEKYVWNRMYP